MSAPPAEGARVAWPDVPQPVRLAIERVCGAPVTRAETQPGGFSPGVAARVRCADGSRWFVKAASAEVNPDAPRFHRREARVLAGLERLIAAGRIPVPRLRGTAETGPWFALVIDDVDGRPPTLPWRDTELATVLNALDQVTAVPAPRALPPVSRLLEDQFTGWRTLAAAPEDDRLDSWSRTRLAELAELEAAWTDQVAGNALLHTDIRADNLLLSDGGAVVVDWPGGCRGAAFVNLVLFAPSVAMQGGPDPAGLLARSRAGREATREQLAAVVCALAGYLTYRSLQPPPPGLPTLRRFQAAQAEAARRWLATLL